MQEVVTSLRLFVLTVVVCGIAYPALILSFATLLVPEKAAGSLVRDEHGQIVGSRLVAQKFTQAKYFWPRPSAVDYNASATGGSNLSPLNPALRQRAEEILAKLQYNEEEKVPVDLVTASASGIDPHISRAAALLQAPRVAAARGLTVAQVADVITQCTDAATLTALGGEPLINVLEVNLALDTLPR